MPGKLVGSLDGLKPAERTFAQELVASGRTVEAVPTSQRKTPDFIIDGVRTELKTISRVARQTPDGLSSALADRIMKARSQSTTVIIDARTQPGMSKDIAEFGIERALGADRKFGSKLQDISVLTHDGIATWRR